MVGKANQGPTWRVHLEIAEDHTLHSSDKHHHYKKNRDIVLLHRNFQRILSRAFYDNVVVTVEVDSLRDRLEDIGLRVGKRRWNIERRTWST